MARIHDNNRLYNFLLPYINHSFRWSYRKVEYRNLEGIPRDGAVIFAPNHVNTLMDALAVLSISDQPKVFVARADIFKNRTAARLLHFLKILPINRIRDGVEALSENEGITRMCIDALCDRVPFCILPEGRHRPMHSLLPLKKGIARIAFGTWERLREEMPVYIVPMGLEYEDFFEFRSRLLVEAGRPICLQDFVADHPGLGEQELYRRLLLELADRMKETILYLPDDERYDALWEAANVLRPRTETSLYERKRAMQKLSDRLLERHPNILQRMQERSRMRKEKHIHLRSVIRNTPAGQCVLDAALLLVSAPLAILAASALLPALLAIALIRPRIKDITFLNAIRYVACYLLNPPVLLLLSFLLMLLLPWWASLLFFAFGFAAPPVFYDWVNGLQHWLSDIRLARTR